MNRPVFFLTRTLGFSFALAAQATTQYWDGGNADIAANGNGISAGTAGTWNTTLLNWDRGIGLAHAAWNSAAPDAAVFGGMPGLVAFGSSITASSVTLNAGGYIFDTSTNTLTLATLAGSGPLTKTGAGTIALSGVSPYTGTLTVNNGLVVLANGASLASAAGIFLQGGAGTVGGTNYPFKGVTRGGALFLRDDSGTPGGAQLGSQTLTLDNGTLLWQSGSGSDFTSLSTVALVGGFNSIGVASVENPDVLKIGNLIRTNSATVEFRAAYHRLGTGEVQIQVANINGSAIANSNGILGGWAFAAAINTATEYDGPARDFAKWDPTATIGGSVSSVVAATPDKANGGGGGTVNSADLASGTATENWLINNGSSLNTISADTTIYSLIEEADLVINNGATLTLASGGLICRKYNFWMQTHSGATGYLTSGIHDLYLQTDGGDSATSDQAIKSIIKDGPSGAVTLRKSGSGKLKMDQINTFTGGTFINQGTLDLQGGGELGCIRGSVTVNPGAVLQFSRADVTGWKGGSTALTTINLNGGNLNVNITDNQGLNGTVINMTGASITGPSNGNIDFYTGGVALNTLASATPSTIDGIPLSPVRQGSTTFNIADGPAAIDLDISSVLRNSPSGDSSGAVLIKSGSGTMRLSATNTLAEPISVSAGTLLLGSSGSLASGCPVTVSNGATLGGDGTANGTVTVASGGLLAPGGVGAIGTLTLANNSAASLTLNDGTIACDVSTDGTSDLIAITGASGTLVLNGANAVAISLPFGPIPAGTYTLMTYAAKSGSGTLSLLPAIRNATLTVGDTSVTLTVAAGGVSAGSLVWLGDDSANAWDTSTANWLFGGAPTAYAANEAVTFDDTGSGSPAITITPSAVTPGALTFNNTAKHYTIGGSAIGGNASLTKTGTGILTLTGVNTFTGPIAVNGGTLEAAATTTDNPSAIGGGANLVTVASGARLLFTGDRAAGYHTGAVIVNGGTITGNGSDLNFAVGTALTFDTAPGTIDGTGLWRRRAANNKIVVTPAGSGSTISIAELNLSETAPIFDVADGPSASDLTVSSTITGDRVLIKQGTGRLTLSGANTYSGGNELLGGIVSISAMSGLGSGYIAPKNGTIIEYTGTGSETRSGTCWFDWAPGAVLNIVNPSATLTLWRTAGYHSQLLLKTGAGTLRYGAASDNPGAGAQVDGGVLESISSANNNFGYLTVNSGGTFRLGTTDGTGAALSDNHQLADGASVTVNAGGTFSQNGKNETIGTLNLNGGTVSGLGTLTVATAINAQSGAASTILGGAAGFTKSTAGTVTLSGANTYGGATTVSGGTLLVNGSHSGGSSYTVTNATLGGVGTISLASGTVAVQAGGTLAPGSASSAGGTLTLSALALGTGATVAIDSTDDSVTVAGNLTATDSVVTVANIASFNKNMRYPILTYGGTATGTPVLIADDSDWFIKHRPEAKTYYLRTNRGNGTLIAIH